MTVIVMCDGAPASIKAIGWAAVPGHLMRQHDGEQLILLHGWSREDVPRVASSRESPDRLASVDISPAQNRLPVSDVMRNTLEAITESKVTRDSLNYKIETVVLSDLFTPMSTTPAATRPQSSKKSPLSKKELAAQQQQQQQAAAAFTEAELEAAARVAEKEAAQSRAKAIALYARERALHHKAEAILLGTGNSMDGKNIIFGLVAKTVFTEMRQTHVLWFIKNNGCTMRLNTALVRYVVVLVPVSNDAGALERDCRVVQYALGRRRERSMDTVSAVIVVESTTPPEEVERYSQALRDLLQRETPATNSHIVEEVADDATPAFAVTDAPIALEKSGTVTAEGTPHEAALDDGEVLPSAEEADIAAKEQQWPEVSLCQLRATKQVPEPTAGNAAGQVVKFLQRYKTDVVVSPSTLAEELQMALLAVSKPHALLVPAAEPAPCAAATMPPPVVEHECTE
ncbi:hypothetical protein C3747_44g48 [Trypanosoma cruzi]|uniref:Uncharacterized protein n=2 Tax=Trypanosoma cruzi TaxID=5693 RepID=Q4DRI0_TRYCC|nr:hypothetical protein, conserved [Trypanosoma cruzi]EAN95119.1 hypothetical protein, conserved [Trypanosoma cruzi]PWV13254.1 hypothetical protein C3747_44g48 [Trypanosoma cruzi]RNC61061.1 hypothetical protein TcCL_ESM01295 [Trypanosoma cruzi]|eukprot:XP_816970.1 hypothetical protein [Trypanosoma cruzi strain CL Brener]